MSEMTPDPVFDTLPRFTPDASRLDSAAILFAAGKASVRTPFAWKLAVAVLVVTNLVAIVGLVLRPSIPAPTIEPVIVPVVIPVPTLDPDPSIPDSPSSTSPWTLAALSRISDPDQFPRPEVSIDRRAAAAPLTPLSIRHGTLD